MTRNVMLETRLRRLLREGILKRLFTCAVARIEQGCDLACEIAEGTAAVPITPECIPLYIPASPQTLFDIASLTKLFSTTALLRLVTMGKTSLDQPAAEAVPQPLASLLGALKDPPITLRALLTHSSGLHAWFPFYACREMHSDDLPRHDAVSFHSPMPSDFVCCFEEFLHRYPRKVETIYSDINFMLVGIAISFLTGMSLDQALKTLVLDPRGLESTGYRPLGNQRLAARAYAPTERGNQIEQDMVAALGMRFSGWRSNTAQILGEANDGNCWYYFGGVAGHAGLFSTAKDLCHLGNIYLDDSGSDAGLLDPSLAALAIKDTGTGRGLGFQFGSRYRNGCGHTGFTGTMLAILPEAHLSIAILTNRLACLPPPMIDPFRIEIMEEIAQTLGPG